MDNHYKAISWDVLIFQYVLDISTTNQPGDNAIRVSGRSHILGLLFIVNILGRNVIGVDVFSEK